MMPSACSIVMTLNAATPPPRRRASWISSAVVTRDMTLLLARCGVDAFPTIRNHIHETPIQAIVSNDGQETDGRLRWARRRNDVEQGRGVRRGRRRARHRTRHHHLD